MKNLKTLSVVFDTSIEPYQIPAFRGAIAELVGKEHEWFHNHNNEAEKLASTDKFHNRYSLIQYKVKAGKKQLHPMLLFLDKSVPEAHELFRHTDWMLNLNGHISDYSNCQLKLEDFQLKNSPEGNYYNLYRWQAFNSINFREYQQLEGERARYAFLEKMLSGHILSFMQGVNWHPEEKFSVDILKINKEKWVSFKKVKVKCFDLTFKSSIAMPEYIGLGRGVSKGFGVLRKGTI